MPARSPIVTPALPLSHYHTSPAGTDGASAPTYAGCGVLAAELEEPMEDGAVVLHAPP